MQHGMTLSLLALVTALGGVVGTQLGRDAIAEIDPIFFSEKPEPSTYHAEYSSEPHRLGASDPAPAYAGWGYLTWRRGPVCWGCPEREQAFVDPRDTPIPTAGRAVVRMVGDAPPAYEAERPVQSRDVKRYASFPVIEDEARRLKHIVDLQRGRTGPGPEESDREAERPVGM